MRLMRSAGSSLAQYTTFCPADVRRGKEATESRLAILSCKKIPLPRSSPAPFVYQAEIKGKVRVAATSSSNSSSPLHLCVSSLVRHAAVIDSIDQSLQLAKLFTLTGENFDSLFTDQACVITQPKILHHVHVHVGVIGITRFSCTMISCTDSRAVDGMADCDHQTKPQAL